MANYIYIEQQKPVERPRPENKQTTDRYAVRRGVIIIDNSGEIEYDSNRPEYSKPAAKSATLEFN